MSILWVFVRFPLNATQAMPAKITNIANKIEGVMGSPKIKAAKINPQPGTYLPSKRLFSPAFLQRLSLIGVQL